MKTKLRNIIIRLNRYKIAFYLFKAIYKIQLFVTKVCFVSNRSFTAMILRRQMVLRDCYPANSDYDITCIVDSRKCSLEKAVFYYARIYRALKKILFPLGEMKLIDLKDFSHHIYYNWINYHDCPGPLCFLYKKHNVKLDYDPKNAANICIQQKTYNFLFIHIGSQIYAPINDYKHNDLIFSRNICKNAEKVKVFVEYLRGEKDFINLDYNSLQGKEEKFMLSEKERKSLVANCEKIIADNLPELNLARDFCFTIKGKLDFLSENDAIRLNEILAPIVRDNGHLLSKLILCNYRLYKTCKVIFLQYKDNLSFDEKNKLYHSANKVCNNLKLFDYVLIKPFPVIVSAGIYNKFNLVEQITPILSDCVHYDFLRREFIYGARSSFSVNKDFLYMCLAEAIDLVNSYVREKNCLYIIELIFGHLMAYNYLLKNKVLYGNFEDICNDLVKGKFNAQQKNIIDLYRAEKYTELSKIDSLHVWNVFKGLIIEEIEKGRFLLSGKYAQN